MQAGQVLLSGVADSPRGCRYMRATGRIWARTWYEWTVPVPLETVLKDGTEPVKTRTHTALDLGRHRIALPAGDSILQGRENCDKIIRYRVVQLPFGLRLPVTLVRETVTEPAVYDGERPEGEARAEGQKQLEAQLAQTIGDDGRVLKADVSAPAAGRVPYGDAAGGVRGTDRRGRAADYNKRYREVNPKHGTTYRY